MTRRYIVRPRGDDWWEDRPMSPGASITVYEPEHKPRKTGLFDHLGNDLYAVDDAEPIGFVTHRTRP